MTGTTSLTERRRPPLPPVTTKKRGQRTAPRRSKGKSAASPNRRPFDRVAFGFWLGAIALGTAGCLLGASMPYHHSIAVAASTVWWGAYLGCLGAGVGGLAGLWRKRAPAAPARGDGAEDRMRVEA